MYNLCNCVGKAGTWQILGCFLLLSGCEVPLMIHACGSLALRTLLKNKPHISNAKSQTGILQVKLTEVCCCLALHHIHTH